MPRELTDEQGKLCWYGDYTGWGKLKNEYALVENIHQPFRLQNQYCDSETGLHYNFFRYYEPNVGRFTQLDPIGLAGGENLYRFEAAVQNAVDPLGLAIPLAGLFWTIAGGAASGAAIDTTLQVYDNVAKGREWNNIDYAEVGKSAAIGGATGPLLGGVAKCAKLGKEIKIGQNIRIAPFGNRKGHPIGKYPHYHRRGKPVNGETPPGQGISRHRPWETKSSDNSWKDRF